MWRKSSSCLEPGTWFLRLLRLALVSLSIAMIASSEIAAQSLPGPAALRWFVVIAADPRENPPKSSRCIAIVTTAADKDNPSRWPNLNLFSLQPLPPFSPQKRFGPFNTKDIARHALFDAGWVEDLHDYRRGEWGLAGYWHASTGCQPRTSSNVPPLQEIAAQPLPGPAAEGWFVLIFANRVTAPTDELCVAIITTAVDKEDPSRWPRHYSRTGQPLPPSPPQTRHGPFNTKDRATQALVDAGWVENEVVRGMRRAMEERGLALGDWRAEATGGNGSYVDWHASSGCEPREGSNVLPVTPPPSQPVTPPPPKPSVDRMVDEVLNNKDPRQKIQTPQQQAKRPPQITRQAAAAPNFAAVVTASEVEGVRQKIRPCLNFPIGVKAPWPDNLIVTWIVQINQDGAPATMELKEPSRYNNDPIYRAVADAAQRAIWSPRCQPWPLNPANFNAWRTVTFNFDPRDY